MTAFRRVSQIAVVLMTLASLVVPVAGQTATPTKTPTVVAAAREQATHFDAFSLIKFSYNLASCADGDACITTVPWDGCLPGDFIALDRPSGWDTDSVWITGERCVTNNLLEFTVHNENGGAFDPDSAEFTGKWWARRQPADQPEAARTSRPTNTPTVTNTPTRTPTPTNTPTNTPT